VKAHVHGLIFLATLLIFATAISWSFYKIGKDQIKEESPESVPGFMEALRAGTAELSRAFQAASWRYAPLAVLMGLLVFPIKALRWRLILGPEHKARFRTLLAAIFIGFMANCIFSRIGEVVRAVVLRMKGEMRTSTALASIALERVFDICTVLLFLIIGLLTLTATGTAESAKLQMRLRQSGVWMSLVLVAAIGFLVMLRLHPDKTIRFVLFFTRWLPDRFRGRFEEILTTFLKGMNTIHSPRQLVAIAMLSLVHWFVQVLFFYAAGLCFPAMGMNMAVALLVFAVTALGVGAVPLPGYLGIYQAAVMAVAVLIGASGQAQNTAWISYSWLSWALNIPTIIIAGFYFLWREDLSLKKLRASAAKS
jgi:hypothetical protein